jgi:hypothetical protein
METLVPIEMEFTPEEWDAIVEVAVAEFFQRATREIVEGR